METKDKKQKTKLGRRNEIPPKKRKSKITLFWEKYPEGILEIMDMKAVLK